jgi:putative ferrous iron transport protein C
MLMELKNHLQEHGAMSMMDLTNHFRTEPDALRGMLDHWIRKGKVKRHDIAVQCPHGGSSCSCAGTCFELYEWVDEQTAAADRRA